MFLGHRHSLIFLLVVYLFHLDGSLLLSACFLFPVFTDWCVFFVALWLRASNPVLAHAVDLP